MCDIFLFLEEKQYCFDRIAGFFPVIGDLKGVEQHPEWHGEGDVYVHTRSVCNAVTSLAEWPGLTGTEKGILYLAALFHDIGKKTCSQTENGVIVSPKHAVVGARLFRELCYRGMFDFATGHHGLSFRFREEIAALIRFHGLPQHFMDKEPAEFYLFKARETASFPLLYLLAKADILGRECRDKAELLTVVDYFREYAMELNCWSDKITFGNAFTKNRYFHGANVRPGETLYDTAEFSVYLMCGLPLAGKDTFIATHLAKLPELSLDRIREAKGIRPDKGSAAVAAAAREEAKIYLRQKQPFVWNATNIVADTRRKLCSLFEDYGARVHIVYIEEPYQVLLDRNKKRERYIPLPVLEHMIKKMEIPEPTESYSVEYYSSGVKS